MKNFFEAIKFGSKFKFTLAALIFLSLLMSVLNALQPIILKGLFDIVQKQIQSQSHIIAYNEMTKYVLLFLAVQMSGSVFNNLNNYYVQLWWTKTYNKLSEETLKHTEELSLTFFEEMGTGKLLERIRQGISDAISITNSFFTNILSQIIFLFIALFFLFRAGAIYGFIVLFGVPLYALIIVMFSKRIHDLQKEVRKSSEKASNIFVETISNVKTIKTFAREDAHHRDYKSKLARVLSKQLERSLVRLKMAISRNFIIDICRTLVLFIGIYQTLKGEMTLGSFILVWSFTGQAFGPIGYLVNQIDDIIRDLVSVERLKTFLDTKPDLVDGPNAIELKKTKGEIEFKNLTFRYKKEKDLVVNNLNIKVNSGETLALVGKSGVGKSTLVKLLLRFYDPIKGSISIDGINICNIKQKSLRENIGVVMQDSVIFNDTVMKNIQYGKPGTTKEDVIRAAKLANAHDFILKLPKGYNTIVGERGVKLSGGEQQRINIARVMLKNPPIIILDEATSSLDSESEKLIQDALWKLVEGKTTIIIAHRLSTVMKADLIAVLDGGKIVEIDNHKNLVKKEGIYANLFKIQSGGYLK